MARKPSHGEARRAVIDVLEALAGELAGEPAAARAVAKRAVCDSRMVEPGDVFAAIPGVRADGAAFVREAAARGAARVVAEGPVPEDAGVPAIAVKDARRAWALLCACQAGRPTEKMHVWGVTGTNGKTTTAWTLGRLLEPLGPAGLVTTVESGWPGHFAPSEHTTPDAGVLQPLFASMLAGGVRRAVMEVSSHSAVQRRIDGIRFRGGIFTNLSEDHLDYHRTMENYFQAKAEFFRRVAAGSPGAPAVVCGDGPWAERMRAEISRLPLEPVSCGLGPGFDFRAENLRVSARGNSFTLVCPQGRAEAFCPLAGAYNAANVLCAFAAALCEGVPFDAAVAALPALEPRWGRLERVRTASAADVFVDFAHTDDALSKVLAAVREFTAGKIWIVFGAGGDRDRAKRPLMGRACAAGADRLVITSDNPRSEDPAAIIAEIAAGVPPGTDVAEEPDRAKAIALALAGAEAGDTVVIAGKGHETVQTAKGRSTPFDDRAAAAAWRPRGLQ